MKFISYINKSNNKERAGIFFNNHIYDLKKCGKEIGIKLPSKISRLLNEWEESKGRFIKLIKQLKTRD
jgi:hypothetical protein